MAGDEDNSEVVTGKRNGLWQSFSVKQTLDILNTNSETGLSQEEASRRLGTYGLNRLAKEERITFWAVAREEITEPMILLLIAVGIIYTFWGEVRDAIAIFVVIAAIVFIEIFNEYRAKAAIASLHRLAMPTAPTIRDGHYLDLPTEELVPGDIVLLSPGERVPADLRLLETVGLRIDESSLTGESAHSLHHNV